MVGGIPAGQDTVIWCAACGIPHASGTAYCSACRQPLDASVGDDIVPPPVRDAASRSNVVAALVLRGPQDLTDRPGASPEESSGAEEAARRPVRQGGALGRRIARRPRPLTEDEIEARAAAIVAQARSEELAGADAPPPLAPPTDPAFAADPLAYLEFLPPLRDRDRQWLVAGLVCCAALVLFTVFFVRYLAG